MTDNTWHILLWPCDGLVNRRLSDLKGTFSHAWMPILVQSSSLVQFALSVQHPLTRYRSDVSLLAEISFRVEYLGHNGEGTCFSAWI